jgi:membrane-bound ClpP family serine protease
VAAIKMPKNHFLRFGVYVVAACALLWLGAVVLAKLIQVFIYIGIGGIALIVIGVLMEWMKSKKAVANAPCRWLQTPRIQPISTTSRS